MTLFDYRLDFSHRDPCRMIEADDFFLQLLQGVVPHLDNRGFAGLRIGPRSCRS